MNHCLFKFNVKLNSRGKNLFTKIIGGETPKLPSIINQAIEERQTDKYLKYFESLHGSELGFTFTSDGNNHSLTGNFVISFDSEIVPQLGTNPIRDMLNFFGGISSEVNMLFIEEYSEEPFVDSTNCICFYERNEETGLLESVSISDQVCDDIINLIKKYNLGVWFIDNQLQLDYIYKYANRVYPNLITLGTGYFSSTGDSSDNELGMILMTKNSVDQSLEIRFENLLDFINDELKLVTLIAGEQDGIIIGKNPKNLIGSEVLRISENIDK